jgi:tRNA-specific 2-thiouridylase
MARVAVAMSGGVDSSVAAALMVEAGHDVVGLTMNLWPTWLPENDDALSSCCGVGAVEDARGVAQRLGIPHYVLNMREAFERAVIAPFASEYARGRTPNPCVACNRAIKFALLLEKVSSLGMDYLATGHYARVRRDGERTALLRGLDRRKDQSYVLYALNQPQLRRLLLPVGELPKEETRQTARRWGLAVADKPDSQEICFVSSGHYSDVVARFRPESLQPGPIVDTEGRHLGAHQGVARYTIGQRRGLGVATGKPLYVVAIDADRNTVFVGPEEDLMASEVDLEHVSWILGRPADGVVRATVRVRHAGAEVPAWVHNGRGVKVTFDQPQRAASPGQAACLYDGDVVLGGGVISNVRTVGAEKIDRLVAV